VNAAGGSRPGPVVLGISAAIVVVLLAVLAVFAIGGGGCRAGPSTVEAEVTATSLEPAEIRLCRGQPVTLELMPRFDGVVHIHGIEVAREVRDGEPTELEFTPGQSGQFPIETHTEERPEGRQIGVLIVDEP